MGKCNQCSELEAKNEKLRRQIRMQDEVIKRKNRELDSLHFVWCDGGCSTGVHRWSETVLTEEIVKEAEQNTKRLRRWFTNHQSRLNTDKESEAGNASK